MRETPVEDVTTPTRNANAISVAMVKRMTAPERRKRGWTTCVFHTTISHIEPIRYSDVGGGEQEAARVARQQQRHAADRAGQVEVDRALLLEARHQVRRREEREERPDEVEEAREAGLESEHELVDLDLPVAEVDGLAEELRAGERAVDDVEVHRRREDQDEERRQREVGDQRPARGRLAEDFLDARGEGPHDGRSDFGWPASRPRARGRRRRPRGSSARARAPGAGRRRLAADPRGR